MLQNLPRQGKGQLGLSTSARARQPRGRKLGNGLPVQGGGQAVLFGDGQDGFDQIVCGQGREATVRGHLRVSRRCLLMS